jgi:ParB-like nuclease domain
MTHDYSEDHKREARQKARALINVRSDLGPMARLDYAATQLVDDLVRVFPVPIDDIKIEEGRRKVSTDKVNMFAESMKTLGLLTQIMVRYRQNSNGETETVLVAGAHRLAAAKQLAWQK